jgi:hypothetical protein
VPATVKRTLGTLNFSLLTCLTTVKIPIGGGLKNSFVMGGVKMMKITLVLSMSHGVVLLAIFSMASVANANLVFNINEAGDTITISGDGETAAPVAAYLLVEGSGSISGGNVIYSGSLAAYDDLEAIAASLWMSTEETLDAFRDFLSKPDLVDLSMITLADGAIPPAPLQGTLVDNIRLTVTGPVVLTLVSDDFATVFDTKIAHVPEPISLSLFALSGLFLLRRR